MIALLVFAWWFVGLVLLCLSAYIEDTQGLRVGDVGWACAGGLMGPFAIIVVVAVIIQCKNWNRKVIIRKKS